MKSGPLTDAELVEVTGYKRGFEQLSFLRRHGLRPFVRRSHPVITWEAINAAMSGQPVKKDEPEPNWNALRKAA